MKKIVCFILLNMYFVSVFGQARQPQEFGYRHLVLEYGNDNVDILIKSKEGEENIKKPLFFMCQGSLPQPLLRYVDDTKAHYRVFPFDVAHFVEKYHLVIVGKPHIPVIAKAETLTGAQLTYADSTGNFPKEYTDRNYLDYYTQRNIKVIKYLQKQPWVSKEKLIVAGHSEGSTIAAKMASEYSKITHLIYSGGNPMGRIMSMLSESRFAETDSTNEATNTLEHWKWILENRKSLDASRGDTPKATFDFSYPSIKDLEKLKIPVLVTYGTKDWSAPFNDYLHVEIIRKEKKNFTFKSYVGTEHNFFPVDEKYVPDYNVQNWKKVGEDWYQWLIKN